MPAPSTSSAPADPVAAGQTDEGAGVTAVEAVEEPTALTFEWDTQFSAFLSPPIEVRRLAKDACVAEGYEIATVETMKLENNVATAIFICRGDFE
jgi:hypothetical protein